METRRLHNKEIILGDDMMSEGMSSLVRVKFKAPLFVGKPFTAAHPVIYREIKTGEK